MAITITSGMRLTPARLNALAPQIARKTADQSVTNSTTLVTDTQLLLPALASAEYDVELTLIYEAPVANDIKVAFSFPSGASLPWGQLALLSSATTTSGDLSPLAYGAPTSSNAFVVGGGGAGNQLLAVLKGTLVMGGTAGSVEFRFAQNTAGVGTSAVVKAGSTLKLSRIA